MSGEDGRWFTPSVPVSTPTWTLNTSGDRPLIELHLGPDGTAPWAWFYSPAALGILASVITEASDHLAWAIAVQDASGPADAGATSPGAPRAAGPEVSACTCDPPSHSGHYSTCPLGAALLAGAPAVLIAERVDDWPGTEDVAGPDVVEAVIHGAGCTDENCDGECDTDPEPLVMAEDCGPCQFGNHGECFRASRSGEACPCAVRDHGTAPEPEAGA